MEYIYTYYEGATTLSMTTLSIMTLRMKTSTIPKLRKTSLGINNLNIKVRINNIQH